jgi:20S proteasome alpha/beta subunit
MPRLTVEFPESTNEVLEKLAEEEGTTKREILRRALSIYSTLHDEGVRIGGNRNVVIVDKDGDKLIKQLVF